jgi:hypothetical protein
MKNWFGKKRRRDRHGRVATELRRSKPDAPSQLVQTIADRIQPRRRPGVAGRTRLGIVLAVGACTVAVIGATGGFSAAATSVLDATRSVGHSSSWQTVNVQQAAPGFSRGTAVSFDSACDMYAEAPTVSGVSPTQGAPGSTVEVSGTNFTGINVVTDVKVGGDEASFRVNSSTSLDFVVPSDADTGAVTVTNCAGTASTSPTFTVEAGPSISGTSPTHGGFGTEVTITGSGFTGVTSVKFNSKADSTFSVDSDSQITAHVPSGAATNSTTHPGSVVVTNAIDSAGASFVVDGGSPTIASFAPTAAQAGVTVKIKGTNFKDDSGNSLVSSVSFNGHDATDPDVVSKTEVDAVVPVGATTGPITVDTSVGSATSKTSFTLVAASPVIDTLTPDYGRAGASVKITGSSLTGINQVLFTDSNGDQTVSATFKSGGDSLITATVPSHAVTGPIEVIRHDGTNPDQTALSDDFTVVAEHPQLAGASPTSGGYGTQVTITAVSGHTLTGVTSVKFNGTSDPTFSVSDDGSTITATVPPKAPAKASGSISVTNASGTSTTPFTVIGLGPTISKIVGTLGNGTQASTGDPISIIGTNLDTVTSVKFAGGATSTSFIWQDTDLLTVKVPNGADTGKITVINPDGQATSSASLTILHAPSVLGFSPAYGRSGTSVKIVGSGFSGTTAVYFAGAPAKFKTVDDNTITATVPSNAATGSVEIIVGRRMDADSGNDEFTVIATKPTLSGFSPDSGNVGDSVTITGSRFIGPMTVKFGSKTATFVHVTSPTSLTAKVPAGTTGTVTIAVSNLAGTATKSGYHVVDVSAVSPLSGARDVTRVTITGSNFTANGTPTVKFGGTTVSSADIFTISSTKITLRVPGGANTGAITVTTGSVTTGSPKTFTVIDPPTVTSYPASGKKGSKITITGTNFVQVKSVTFHGAAASFKVVSPTSITVTVPTKATTGSITVTTIAGSDTGGGVFTVTH